MGISYSKLNKSKDCEMIDFIASHYIFTMNFNSLKKLFENLKVGTGTCSYV